MNFDKDIFVFISYLYMDISATLYLIINSIAIIRVFCKTQLHMIRKQMR